MANNPRGGAADGSKLTRHDFPPDFIFGGSTSSYQIEGAYSQDRKSHCNWDCWSQNLPGKILDGHNGCVAIDHYNRVKDDVKLLKKLGIDCYRFSISWPRILPGGGLSQGVNKKGVKFYNDLIDLLLVEGITPFVTIFHFDIPQCVQEYGGFLKRKAVLDFAEYAEVCFFEFGDRVKHWITINEPVTFTTGGYINGTFPPGHGSTSASKRVAESNLLAHRTAPGLDQTITGGDAGTEPYIVAHHLLLSHAKAVDIYRRKYQAVQEGKIGITNMSGWYEPYDAHSQDDIDAASRAVDFQWGWFTAPVVTGDYPPIMRNRVGSRLPTFKPEEEILMKGSFDFIGMNYYTTYLAQSNLKPTPKNPTFTSDEAVKFHQAYPDGTPIGEQAASTWLYIVPRGIYGLLNHNATKYDNPIVYITENGVDEKNERIPISKAIQDDYRIDFFQKHFVYMKKAIDEGVNLKGYMLWSLFDNFEWAEGYTVRFGMYYVDYINGLVRYPKNSAIWYMNFLNKNPPLPSTKRLVHEEVEEENNPVVKRKRNRN